MHADSAVAMYNTLMRVGADFAIPRGFDLQWTLESHLDSIFSLAWSPMGDQIAAVGTGSERGLRIWNTDSGHLQFFVQCGIGSVYSVDWSPDGRLLAAAGSDRMIHLWDRSGFSPMNSIDAGDEVYDISWSKDSRSLAFAGHLMTSVCDVASGASALVPTPRCGLRWLVVSTMPPRAPATP